MLPFLLCTTIKYGIEQQVKTYIKLSPVQLISYYKFDSRQFLIYKHFSSVNLILLIKKKVNKERYLDQNLILKRKNDVNMFMN